MGIRPPAERRARPQGARAGGGLRGYRGRLGLADRAEEMCGSGKGEEHSGHPGQAGDREIVPSGGARGSAATSETPGQGWRGKVGDRRRSTEAGIPRALGSSGRCTRQGAAGAGWGPGDRTERRRESVSSDIGDIRGKVGEARLGDRRRSIRKAAFGRKGQEFRGLWVRPVFPRARSGAPRPNLRPLSRPGILPYLRPRRHPDPHPSRSRAAPPVTHRSPCPIFATPVRRNGLLTLTRYEPALCERGNPCGRHRRARPQGARGVSQVSRKAPEHGENAGYANTI